MKLGRSIDDGALTVVEQIPGLVEFSDQTQALRRGNASPVPASDAARLTDPYGASFPLSRRLQVTGRPTTFPSTGTSTS